MSWRATSLYTYAILSWNHCVRMGFTDQISPSRWPFKFFPGFMIKNGALWQEACTGQGLHLFLSVTLLTNTPDGSSQPGSHWGP